ncbi:oligosaccharide flippase family protein [Zobellia nedashkovskayae]|uniref:oligosaccharide flippase family protein n=1 Tax=Zobellia nedashkovskayae TaxID=2779510 RepID=UPI001889F8C7|nr:oligosaccharide flippase family protein [Zobellia nedashkovskayae]
MLNSITKLKSKLESKVLKNSFWGLAGSLFQNVFLSLFYVLIARHYSVDDFAKYIIANSLYQMIVAFSSMGLGHWFIREVINHSDKNKLAAKFLKMQAYFGIFFFSVNLILAFFLYTDSTVRILSLLFAANIIFDNIIYSIKNVNIAQFSQKKTVLVLSIEAFSKFVIACLLFVYPFSIIYLAILLVITRFITLNLFLRIGAAEGFTLTGFWREEIPFSYIKGILSKYWPFAVIGSAYVIYWKIDTLIISKILPLEDVAHYENSFKIFSLAQLVPVVLSSTMLPKLVELHQKPDKTELQAVYKKIFRILMLYGLGAFTFTYSFADELVPWIFGEKYAESAQYTKEMFFTILVFPTSLLQANMLIAMKLEKLDMWFNINSVLINSAICLIGLYFIKSLSIVNYAIFISFIIFHISQDVVLLKNKIVGLPHIVGYLLITLITVCLYMFLQTKINDVILFPLFWIVIGLLVMVIFFKTKHNLKF